MKTDNSTTDWLNFPVSGRESTLILSGSTEQSVAGDFSGSNAIYQLTVNNNAGITIVNTAQTGIAAGGDVEISNQLTLTNGLIQTDTDNSLRIQADATISGGGEFTHINGPLVREMRNGSNDYFFPVGSQGRYGRIDLENPAGFTGTKDWSATYFWALNPYDLFTMTANAITEGVEKASTFEYWNLDAASPANANVRPYWDSNSDVTDPSDLRVIFWDETATAWEVLPEVSAPSGSSASGNLSAGPLSFSTKTVTFGSINQTITLLPVELIYFRGESRSKGNLLIWATASETENAFFEVLRSKDGKNFEPIGRVGAKGDPNNKAEYNFMDRSPYSGTSYYLLKQVDKDGNFSNSEVIAIKYERFGNEDVTLSAYPNPVTSEEFELLGENWQPNRRIHFKVLDISGNIMIMDDFETNKNGIIQKEIDMSDGITQGLYIIMASDGVNQKSVKVIIK